MMYDQKYLHHLYDIASQLNREFSLAAALRVSLEKTIAALELQTGWIWLVEKDLKSVYLAASYNLPPALKDYPERLSGWCYCIERYLSDHINQATNISEITCTRLKDLVSGTHDLRFHATIPIRVAGQKVGLINLLSKEKQQLDDQALRVLNSIGELVGITIQRTRLQETYIQSSTGGEVLHDVIRRIFTNRIDGLVRSLQQAIDQHHLQIDEIREALTITLDLQNQVAMLLTETTVQTDDQNAKQTLKYPTSPLTSREIEVLLLVKTGLTNAQIAEQLYIAERTVKFHMTSILSKLHAKTRTQAVDIALSRGLISPAFLNR